MRIQQTELFTFEELTEDAQSKALLECWDWNVRDSYWYESVFECIEDLGQMIGISFIGGQSRFQFDLNRGSFFAFEGDYSYVKQAEGKIRATFRGDTADSLGRIARDLQQAQRRAFYTLTARVRFHHYGGGSVGMDIDVEDDGTRSYDALKEPCEAVEEALNNFAGFALSMLSSEYEYQTSDEAIKESLIANEVEFTKDGTRA